MKDAPFKVIGHVGSVWIVSSVLFYLVHPAINLDLSYNTAPVGISIFYALWVAIAGFVFSDIYRRHIFTSRDVAIEGLLCRVSGYIPPAAPGRKPTH
jgi:hypothetical protein